jgi:hypothetical protein
MEKGHEICKLECYKSLQGRFNQVSSRGIKGDVIKDSFHEEQEQVFNQFPGYHMKIFLRDFNAKVGREGIFKPIIGNEHLHEASYDNGGQNSKFCNFEKSNCQEHNSST